MILSFKMVIGIFILYAVLQCRSKIPLSIGGNSKKSISVTTATESILSDQFTALNYNSIRRVKKQIKNGSDIVFPAYTTLLRAADKAMEEGVFSVMQKTKIPPGGDMHDYLSIAPYWWPDSSKSNGLPWIRKDGEINPMTRNKHVDVTAKKYMMKNVELLSLAYFFSDNKKYAHKAIRLLHTWFIDPETKMNPNLNYAQGIPGKSQGRAAGIIEFAGIIKIITAIEILELKNLLDIHHQIALRKWLSTYLNWLQTSKLGMFGHSRSNNHGTFHDLQATALLLFLRRIAAAKTLLETVKTNRINAHIRCDGKQPEELKRTKSLSYSILNLSGLTQLAFFGKKVGVDLWHYTSENGSGIQKAYAFLYPYATKEKIWEYQQITPLNTEIKKLQMLFIKAGHFFKKKSYCDIALQLPYHNDIASLLYPCFP